jgi:phosphate/phosphite/phosphonate ABC transporter binding protein
MNRQKPIVVGAVAYDPKVVTIWEIIKKYFEDSGVPMDYVLYSNYESMVEALIKRHIDIAWNSPLAWVRTQMLTKGACKALAMRDTDQNLTSIIYTRIDTGIQTLADLKGKTLALGAIDSPQASLLPLHHLTKQGIDIQRDIRILRFNLVVGKHGDHIGGEEEALKAVQRGEADAGAMLDLNWVRFANEGKLDTTQLKILASTDPYDHCNFTALEDFDPELEKRWTETLFKMDYNNPEHRYMMDLEGLKEWRPARTHLYKDLAEAVQEQKLYENYP